ncbi:protein CREG2 isoform X2 [Natator depressus]|uniref:protein CREG2 isoform X2 n=1 Tax=Natator depressus TaxID=27790 RepID=UPI003EBBA910
MSVCCCQIQLRKRTTPISWLSWVLWCSVMLSPAWGYVIVNWVSWSVTNEVEEELDSSSNEEALPALLEDTTSIWKQSYPASVYKEDGEMRSRPVAGRSKQISSPSRMFSYRRESVKGTDSITPQEQAIRTARFLTHYNGWGFLATESTQEKDNTVTDLMKNSVASLTLPEAEGDFCRKNIIDPEDPRCARLTLTGQMVMVPPEEMEFAKQAMFSRHPVMRKWPRNYEWFFMKMNIEHIWLQNWYGGVSTIVVEEYFKAVPSKE